MTLPLHQEKAGDPNRQGRDDQKSSLRPVDPAGRRRWRIPPWLIGGCALAVALAGFWSFNHHGKQAAGDETVLPVSVRIAPVRLGDMPVVERTIGTVVSNAMVQVTAMVPGPLERADFREGQMVRKGDPLFLIDPRSYQAALNQAKGQLTRDQATLAGAERDLARYQSLMRAHAGTQQALEDQEATVASDRGVVESDKAVVSTAAINLGYTLIRSPINGKTGPILIQPGNVISVTGTTASTTPLVTITQVNPIKLSFSLPQSELPRIQARQKSKGLVATLDLRNSGGKELTAPVDFIGNVVNDLTGTVELRVTLDNRDGALVPGQLVDVTVELNEIPHAIIVPHDAVNDGPAGHYVYAVADGRAQLRQVKVLFDDARTVAVEGDLRPGENVVVDGQLRVVPGGPVSIDTSPGYVPSVQGAAITSVPE